MRVRYSVTVMAGVALEISLWEIDQGIEDEDREWKRVSLSAEMGILSCQVRDRK
jgi:hypothetical protein